MRGLTLVFAGIAVVAGVVSGKLWLDLRAEKLANEELKTQLAQARMPGRQALLPAASANTPSASTSPAATPGTQTATPDPQARDAERRARLAEASSTISALASSLTTGSSEQDLLKDPEYRKARLAQLRIQIARTYPGLVEELGLSAREADQFFNLMAENQLKMTTDISSRAASASGIADLVRNQAATRKEQEDAVRAILGNSRYEQYQAYQQTRPARQQVVTMGSQLANAGAPLSDAQSRALTSVMIAEQQRQRQQPQPQIARNIDPANPQAQAAQILGESQRRQEENNQRVLDAVAPQLNAKQLAVLKEQLDQQNATRRNTLSRLQGIGQRLAVPAQPQRP